MQIRSGEMEQTERSFIRNRRIFEVTITFSNGVNEFESRTNYFYGNVLQRPFRVRTV
jgi:hypothetical protein